MKKIFTLFIGIVFSFTILNAQDAPPQAFSFKAMIKDKYGCPVILRTVSLRISILQDAANGSSMYVETFRQMTNLYAQVDVEIGRGTIVSGIFAAINWSAGAYFLKVEVDPKGGTSYQVMSVSQLLSVPYALYSGSAANSFSGYYSDLIGTPIFAQVAISGSYFDLSDRPPLFSGDYNDLLNKPSLFDGTWGSLSGKPVFAPIALSGSWEDLDNTPVTLSGYGIADAISTTHPAYVITAENIANWNIALSWGNHANEGYLKSITETDPVFLLHPAHGIASENINNWNAAYGWGDHVGLYRPVSYVPAWSEVSEKPTFATVATSGSYSDLINKPTTDGSETKVTAGTNVTIEGRGTEASPYVINSTGGSGNLTLDALLARVEKLEGLLKGTTISDADGNIYNTVIIGEQVWMAENLYTTKLNNGTPLVLASTEREWRELEPSHVSPSSNGVCWYYFDTQNKAIYGGLYNIHVATNNILCPTGWSLPTVHDWDILLEYIGGLGEGGKLRETGTAHWSESDPRHVTNETGFTALPGGFINVYGHFDELGEHGYWWGRDNKFPLLILDINKNGAIRKETLKSESNVGYSVRCIKETNIIHP